MKKVLLLIDCDACRKFYVHSRFASEDTTAWDLHGRISCFITFKSLVLLQKAQCHGQEGESGRAFPKAEGFFEVCQAEVQRLCR